MLALAAFASAAVVRRAEVETGGEVTADDLAHPTRGDPHLHNDGHLLMSKFGRVPGHFAAQCYNKDSSWVRSAKAREYDDTPHPDDRCDKIENPTVEKCTASGCGFAPAIDIQHSPQSPKLVPNCYCDTRCGETTYEGHDITKMYEPKLLEGDYEMYNFNNPLGPDYNPSWSNCHGFEGNGPNRTCHHMMCASCSWVAVGRCDDPIKKKTRVWPLEDQELCCSPHMCAAEYEITEHWDAQDAAGALTGEKASRVIRGVAHAVEGEHPAPHEAPNSGCKSTAEWTTRGFKTEHEAPTYSTRRCYPYGIFSWMTGGEC